MMILSAFVFGPLYISQWVAHFGGTPILVYGIVIVKCQFGALNKKWSLSQ